MDRVYLDVAATAERNNIDDIIIDAMTKAMRTHWRNPSSLYASDVKKEIDRCRADISKFINAEPEEIYFTSGASEANNWAIHGWLDYISVIEHKKDNIAPKIPYIITTPIEHKSILSTINNDVSINFVHMCEIDDCGNVILKSLEQLLHTYKNEYVLVSIHMANNEIGTIQAIKDVSELVNKYGATLHVDATQAFGKIPIDVKTMGIDMMSCSGHKVSSVLRGIGFLYKRNGINIKPIIYGAQEQNLRGGTENTYGIVGLSKALKYCDIDMDNFKEMCFKRDYFIDLLESKFGCELNGDRIWRLPNNINITFPQSITGESLLYILDTDGIEIGVGSACNSKSIEPSHVLKAIGLSDEETMRSVRFTLPSSITYKQIDYVIEKIDQALKLMQLF